jgi:hypothetical protein
MQDSGAPGAASGPWASGAPGAAFSRVRAAGGRRALADCRQIERRTACRQATCDQTGRSPAPRVPDGRHQDRSPMAKKFGFGLVALRLRSWWARRATRPPHPLHGNCGGRRTRHPPGAWNRTSPWPSSCVAAVRRWQEATTADKNTSVPCAASAPPGGVALGIQIPEWASSAPGAAVELAGVRGEFGTSAGGQRRSHAMLNWERAGTRTPIEACCGSDRPDAPSAHMHRYTSGYAQFLSTGCAWRTVPCP